MDTNKILVVDDDKDILLALTVQLRAAGFQVVQAVDAVSAISVARKESPDVVILDLGLPGGDGFLVMERLKALPVTASVPVIVLTARDAEGNQEHAYEVGASDFLQKPVSARWLMKAIEFAMLEKRTRLIM